MTQVVWYPVSAGLVFLAAYSVWVGVAGLRRRRLDVGAFVVLVASLGSTYVILPYLLPPTPPAPDADGFVRRYDIRTRTTWITPTLVLLLVVCLAGGFLFAAVRSHRARYWSQFRLAVLVLVLVLGGGGYAATAYFREAWTLVRAAGRGDYEVAEGPVTDYELTRYKDRWHESFRVGEVRFAYSSSSPAFGFDRPAPRGGPIRSGLHVRIAHRGNVILRLETREELGR